MTTLVRVHTDTGRVGIGSAYTLPALMHHIVDNQLAPLEVVDGQIMLPAEPGLGIELNEATIEKHRVPDPYQLPNGCYSDMVIGRDHFQPAPAYESDAGGT